MPKKSPKIKNGIQFRLPIWQKYLTSPDGVTVSEIEDLCYDIIEDSENPKDILRKDIQLIRELLKTSPEAELITKKEGKSVRYRLEGTADLMRLRQEKLYGSESVSLLSMLHQMEGVLPDGVLEEVTTRIRKLEKEQSESNEKIVIAYETNGAGQCDNGFFYPIYKAIHEKRALQITSHSLQATENHTVILYPEFLRQYKTLWYVFGYATDADRNPLPGESTRLPLHLIEEVLPLPPTKFPFRPSGIEDYLDDYFSKIIGIDNIFDLPVEEIRFAIHRRMLSRLQIHPLHESMRILKSTDSGIPNYITCSIQVKENKELIRSILEMGSDIVILSPEHLRKKISKEIKKINLLYSL